VLGGRTFVNQDELVRFIEGDILKGVTETNQVLEVTNNLHIEILLSIFKFSTEDFCTKNINKIVYGPDSGSGGNIGCFQIKRLVAQEEENQVEKFKPEKYTFPAVGTFLAPSKKTLRTETIPYLESISRMFSDIMFQKEQEYIQQVNSVFLPQYLNVLGSLIKRYPLMQKHILDNLLKSFPHHRTEKLTLICSVRNLMSVAILIPGFEGKIVAFILELLIKLDCEIKIGQNKVKIDEIMELMIMFMNHKLDIEPKSTESLKKHKIVDLEGAVIDRARSKIPISIQKKEEFVHFLLKIFSERVIKVEKPNVIHFLYYYISSLSGDFQWIKEAYLQQLIVNLLNRSLQRQVKLHSLYYLFSFLRSSTFLTDNILHTSLTYLIQFLVESYDKYLKRNPRIGIRRMTSHEIKLEQAKRIASTENTNAIGDDIFVFCYQSCLDLYISKGHLMNPSQRKDIISKFDELTLKTPDFISFSIAESETFLSLFKAFNEMLEDSITKGFLDDLVETNNNHKSFLSSKVQSPSSRKVLGQSKLMRIRNIDYFPFRPIRMNFFDKFISANLQHNCYTESFNDNNLSPFHSSLSQIDTMATEGNKPVSPMLGKRKDYESIHDFNPVPTKKYSN
jgi:hypothetical protein